MGEWLARRTPQPQDRGFESCQNQLAHQKPSRVGYGWWQWCLCSLSRKWVPGYRQRWQLYLDYQWRLEACKWVYTPQGVEQVMDITGLPGIIICKALWASFGKEKALYRNCILLLLLLNNITLNSMLLANGAAKYIIACYMRMVQLNIYCKVYAASMHICMLCL